MIYPTEEKRSLGVNFSENGDAEILIWAPQAETLELTVIEKSIRFHLNKNEYGYWQGSNPDLKPGDLYKIILNGNKERPDPASLAQPEGVHGNSQAFDLRHFKWNDGTWKNLPLENYLLYELHIGTFTPDGNFAGLEEKLDYLLDLGVNAIELMPVSQFPGNRNWGYDGVFPYAVQNSYGGASGLQLLVNRCHEKGLAVVLDVVYNHLGPEGNYLADFAPYFTDKYNTPWGKAINFDDAWCDGVRHYFVENALMWFRDFHIDALRLDAVHAIKDFSPNHILREIKQQVDKLMEKTGRKHYLIAELDLNDVRFINPLEKGGYGLDAQWIDEFHHALRVTSGEPQTGYYSDFNGISYLAKAFKDAYVYDGIYSPHRYKIFGTKTDENPGKQFVVFSQNHDHVGNRMLGERTSQLVSFEMQKLLAGCVICSPYLPMLFMGEEWSAPNPFQYFVSHSDPDLVEAVRKGRKAEFAAFHAKDEAPDPQSEDTFNRSKLDWGILNQGHHNTMFRFYREMLSLRKKHPVLATLNRKQVAVNHDSERKILTLYRWQNEHEMLAIMNFSQESQTVSLKYNEKHWKKLFDSADPKWTGPAAAPDALIEPISVLLQPESFLIYTN